MVSICPYNFDFLTLREPIAEWELEEGLVVRHRKTRGADRGARRTGPGVAPGPPSSSAACARRVRQKGSGIGM